MPRTSQNNAVQNDFKVGHLNVVQPSPGSRVFPRALVEATGSVRLDPGCRSLEGKRRGRTPAWLAWGRVLACDSGPPGVCEAPTW